MKPAPPPPYPQQIYITGTGGGTIPGGPATPGTGFPGSVLPGFGPTTPPTFVPAPVITISTPLASPPQRYTNFATLINGQADIVAVMLFMTFQRATPLQPDGGVPGGHVPGYGLAPISVLLTEGIDYTRSGGLITMTSPPQPGSTLTATVFAKGVQLGGSTPKRYIAPWSFAVAGPFDGVATIYQIQLGPTLFGVTDGRNALFTWGVAVQRCQVFRNGILQTIGTDVFNAPTAMVFLRGAIPVPGDIITMLGY